MLGSHAWAMAKCGRHAKHTFRKPLMLLRKDRGGVGVGGNLGARAYIDLSPSFRGRFPETCCIFVTPFLNRAFGALFLITVKRTRGAMDFSEVELGPKMQACNERERKFVWFYVIDNDGNASEAARKAGYSDPGGESGAIRVQAHAVLHRDRVLAAIEEVGRKTFRGLLMPAVRATQKLIENEKHPDHAKAVSSTLARLGITERTGVDVNVTGEIQHNHTDAALSDLRALLALQVPREKLIEIFGFSGLSRYEKMLGEADRRAIAAPVIDGEFSEVQQGETK